MARIRSRIYQCLWIPVSRLLRKKTVLAVILSLSFIYCMVNLYNGKSSSVMHRAKYHGIRDPDNAWTSMRDIKGPHIQPSLDNEPHRVLNAVLSSGNGFEVDENLMIPGGTNDGNIMNKLVGSSMSSGNNDKLESSNVQSSCRNSIQGRVLISDDKGFVCHRKDVKSSGCCSQGLLEGQASQDRNGNSLKKHQRYSCETCNMETGCCAMFEYCTSCCLDPEKYPLIRKVVSSETSSSSTFLSHLKDPFDFCLAKCRTSSKSVLHENSYRDPKTKHCFATESVMKTLQSKVSLSTTSSSSSFMSEHSVVILDSPVVKETVAAHKESQVEKPNNQIRS